MEEGIPCFICKHISENIRLCGEMGTQPAPPVSPLFLYCTILYCCDLGYCKGRKAGETKTGKHIEFLTKQSHNLKFEAECGGRRGGRGVVLFSFEFS